MSSSKNSKMIELTRETLESSSIHAIPNITKSKFLSIKIMWFICLLGSAGVCGWFISSSLIDYFEYNVVSKTNLRYANKLGFPIVSICDLTPIRSPDVNGLIYDLFATSFPDERSRYFPKAIINYGGLGNLKIDKTSTGKRLSDVIINCYFGVDLCNQTNDFDFFYDPNYGNCFRYNSGKNWLNQSTERKFVTQNGLLNALVLDLNVGTAAENNNFFSYENGYIFFISDETVDSTSRDGIMISPGQSTRIVLNKYTITKPPHPYTECIADLTNVNAYDSDLFRRTYSSERVYHYSDCITVCYQKFIGEKCKCEDSIYDFEYDSSMRKCTVSLVSGDIFEDARCQAEYSKLFFNTTKYIEGCDCPIECDRTSYSFTTSSAEFPTFNYSVYLYRDMIIQNKISINESFSFQFIKERVARVSVYFDEMRETIIINDIKTSLSDLVSNIGGTLGLFLGLSFLSVIELVEILMQIVLVILDRQTSKTNTTSQSTNQI